MMLDWIGAGIIVLSAVGSAVWLYGQRRDRAFDDVFTAWDRQRVLRHRKEGDA